jgi:hypothetical protein
MAIWRTKACDLFGFKAGAYCSARGKVDLFADLVEMIKSAIAQHDESLLNRVVDYVYWAASQKSEELTSAVDLAFLLPAFQDVTLCSELKKRLAKEMFSAKWRVLIEEPMTVALVLDPNYGTKLNDLVRRMPVWVADTPENRSVTEELWKQYREAGSATELSIFKVNEDMSLEESCLSILNTIDLHHGEYSSDPPYDMLEVIGIAATPNIRNALSALGFATVIDSPAGFQASRS